MKEINLVKEVNKLMKHYSEIYNEFDLIIDEYHFIEACEVEVDSIEIKIIDEKNKYYYIGLCREFKYLNKKDILDLIEQALLVELSNLRG